MALNASTTLPYSVQQVTEVFTDEAFLRHTSEHVGGTLTSAKVDGAISGPFELTVVRAMPTTRLPDFAKKFIGETLNVTQTEKWAAPAADGSRTADVQITVAGVPVDVAAVQRLVPEGDGTRVELEGQVSSSIPFIGPKIAEAAEPMMAKALNIQAQQVQAWLDKAGA
jgi:Protein of unknown function (DUF2505)